MPCGIYYLMEMQKDRDILFYIRELMYSLLLNRGSSLWKERFSYRNEYREKEIAFNLVYRKEGNDDPKEDLITNNRAF